MRIVNIRPVYSAMLVLLCAPSAMACQSQNPSAVEQLENSGWPATDCEVTDRPEAYVGVSQARLHSILGEPSGQELFRLGSGVTEFRIELLNLYPIEDHTDRLFLEQTWSTSRCSLTIWSTDIDGRATSIDAIIYPNNIEF